MKTWNRLLLVGLVAGAAYPVWVSAGPEDLGGGTGILVDSGDGGVCDAPLLENADGTYENGYGWSGGGALPPDYGAFAERYAVPGQKVCSVVFDFTATGNQAGQTMDVYVWDSADGMTPTTVTGVVTDFDPGAIAFWPSISRHEVEVDADCSATGTAFVGFWGNWGSGTNGWFIAADTDGVGGGLPSTNYAPGQGFPTGWGNVSAAWGPTQALGISARAIEDCTTPTVETTWGQIKALY